MQWIGCERNRGRIVTEDSSEKSRHNVVSTSRTPAQSMEMKESSGHDGLPNGIALIRRMTREECFSGWGRRW